MRRWHVFVVATWVAHWYSIVPCPEKINPYNGQPDNFQTSQACFEPKEKEMMRAFESMDKAKKFFEGCGLQGVGIFMGKVECTDIVIDGKKYAVIQSTSPAWAK